jgi:putative transposase
MLVYEYKLRTTPAQQAALNEAIRITQFLRNTCLRLWMDGQGVGANDLQLACSRLAHEYDFVAPLNSQARPAAADRGWAAIQRFYANCRAKTPGKKGYPRFQHDCRSVEYKGTGWQLDPDGRHLTLTDGCGIGRVKLIRSRDLASFPVELIKRVRLLRRADGYYAQFVLQAERQVAHVPTGRVVGIDVGLHVYLMDSEGQAVANPRFIQRVERLVRRRSQQLARKSLHHKHGKKPKQNHAARQRAKHNNYPPAALPVPRPAPLPHPQQPVPTPPAPASASPASAATTLRASRPRPHRQSANWHTARQALAKTYLKLQRQREDFARKQASALVLSRDLIALEDLQARNLVRNRYLAKAILDAGWARFRHWVEYHGRVQQVTVRAVPPQYTSQKCSGCGALVRKSLSVRTHICPHCGLMLDRDHNAALRIRQAGLAQAIEQGIWDPVGHGSVHGVREHGLASGTVGHTET